MGVKVPGFEGVPEHQPWFYHWLRKNRNLTPKQQAESRTPLGSQRGKGSAWVIQQGRGKGDQNLGFLGQAEARVLGSYKQ